MKLKQTLELESLVRKILEVVEPESCQREGLLDTPRRVAKMYSEIFKGYDPAQLPVVTTFKNGSDGIVCREMITDEGTFYSQCEHHMVPFFGRYYFAYIPSEDGKLLGLSKVARVVDYFSARLQVQERLVQQIANHLTEALSPPPQGVDKDGFRVVDDKMFLPPLGMALIMKGQHLCKCMRGVRKEGWMTTSYMGGVFRDNASARNEFLTLTSLGRMA